MVPSEAEGTVHLCYARRDRTVAVALAASLASAIAGAAAENAPAIIHLSDSTPATPPHS